MTDTVALDVLFKGKRNYITGADIANSMLNISGTCSRLRIEFHHMADCALAMRELTSPELPAVKHRDDVHALMSCTDAGGMQRYWIAQSDLQAPRPLRVDYDESVYTRRALIQGAVIKSDAESLQANPLDALVALNKHLLNHCVEVHPWIFVRLDLLQWPFGSSHVELKFAGNAAHGIHRSTILSDGIPSGFIYFARRSAP